MKKDNQGFVLIETLIVSTFIIATLVFLFTQFSNIKKNYDMSFKYNTINGLYGANNINKYLKKIDKSVIVSTLTTTDYIEIQTCDFVKTYKTYCIILMEKLNIKKAIVIKDKNKEFKIKLKTITPNPFNEGLYQFIQNTNTKDSENYRLIIEYNDKTYTTIKI